MPPILFFDGVCNLCNKAVQVFIRRDPEGKLRFASLQSDLAKEMLPKLGLDPEDMNSLVFVKEGKAYLRSEGALLADVYLGGWQGAFSNGLRIFPIWLRDGVYRIISRNRYRWCGKQDACMIPRPEWKERFLE
jgi:predicted DCC family thiol-disulfide oxidoreductase YuxK